MSTRIFVFGPHEVVFVTVGGDLSKPLGWNSDSSSESSISSGLFNNESIENLFCMFFLLIVL